MGRQTSAGWGKCVNITRQMALLLLRFYDSLIPRHFSCFDKKKTSATIVINAIQYEID